MTRGELQATVERLSAEEQPDPDEARRCVEAMLRALERGAARAAEPVDGAWQVRRWVKLGVLLAFRFGRDVDSSAGDVFRFRDRDTLPPAEPGTGVRIVPGGTTVRRGSYLGPGVVVMPPAFVNVGAWVGSGSMIDSHALVGSCAQVGEGVHVSAAVQIGGVLEPVGAQPVVVEDGAFLGGGCGVYEGVRIGRRAVLAPGVIISRSTPIYDIVHDRVVRPTAGEAPHVPPDAVVVPGSRPARGEVARQAGVQLQAPVIVKYRDENTSASVTLETALR